MDYKSFTSLLLRLVGALIIVSFVTSAPRTFAGLLLSGGIKLNTTAEIWLLTVAHAVPLLTGLYLIYFPATVANRMVSADAVASGALLLQQVAFSVLGLYFVTVAISDAFYWWAKLLFSAAVQAELAHGLLSRLLSGDFAGIASTAAQFIAGMVLLFGGRDLATLMHRLLSAPAFPDVEPPSE